MPLSNYGVDAAFIEAMRESAHGVEDDTVIGRAVNEASRVEALTKEVGVPLVITEKVAPILDVPLRSVGSFELKGVEAPMEIFALDRQGAASSG